MSRKGMMKHGKEFAAANPAHFRLWLKGQGINQGVAVSASQWSKYGFSVKNLKAQPDTKKIPLQKPDLFVACPATGFIKNSCGCPRCKNAKRVR